MNSPETRDLLVAAASILADCFKAHEDGKITLMEAGRIAAGNLGNVIAACSGISKVADEIAAMTPEGMDALYGPVMAELGWSEYQQARNIFDTLFAWVRGTLLTVITLRNLLHPPRAEAVPES